MFGVSDCDKSPKAAGALPAACGARFPFPAGPPGQVSDYVSHIDSRYIY